MRKKDGMLNKKYIPSFLYKNPNKKRKNRQHKKYARCKQCGSIIEKTGNKRTYCDKCARKLKKESNIKADKKYKNKKRENRKS